MRRPNLKLNEITTSRDKFFSKERAFAGEEDIEIVTDGGTVIVIDHNRNEGILAEGSKLKRQVIIDTVVKKTSLFNSDELDKDLSWENTIKPGVVKSEGKTYNVFINRRGERCFTDGIEIFKSADSPTQKPTSITPADCRLEVIDISRFGIRDRMENLKKRFASNNQAVAQDNSNRLTAEQEEIRSNMPDDLLERIESMKTYLNNEEE